MSRLPANIAARRAEEDRIAAASRAVATINEAGRMATFEARTDAKIQDRLLKQRIEQGRRAAAAALDARRRRCVCSTAACVCACGG